jgi:hypothetical protein
VRINRSSPEEPDFDPIWHEIPILVTDDDPDFRIVGIVARPIIIGPVHEGGIVLN